MIPLGTRLTDSTARLAAIIAFTLYSVSSILFSPTLVSYQQLLHWLPYANWI